MKIKLNRKISAKKIKSLKYMMAFGMLAALAVTYVTENFGGDGGGPQAKVVIAKAKGSTPATGGDGTGPRKNG